MNRNPTTLERIEKEINKLKEDQANRLEYAYRKDERNRLIKELQHEMLMVEHRQDLTKKDWWENFKEILEDKN